ncbi:uncharacterized protein LOC133353499 [Lethenteron reissneri]|uniref:uncharacterized protein LOC133353499 n=1 Tax=Lethenteron reissneri TaxID=7753 RepID=UPI002AB600EC|nr:uncharacterized protein LOC133353499 [Lethenteron reissneri]XP_061425769.1 uncharacterized protein LOC133353499 [Lethenteron reissneri]
MSTSFYDTSTLTSSSTSLPDVDPTTNASVSNATWPAHVARECLGFSATAWYLYLGLLFPVGLLGNSLVLYTYWRTRVKRQLQESLDALLMALAAADLVSVAVSPSWVSSALHADAAPRSGPGCLVTATLFNAAHYASAYLLLLVVCQCSFEVLGPPHGSFARRLRANPLAAALFATLLSVALSIFTTLIANAGGRGHGSSGVGGGDDGRAEECLSCRPDPRHGPHGGDLFKFFLGLVAPACAMSPFAARALREVLLEGSPPPRQGGEAARRRAERRRPYRAPFGIAVAWAATRLLYGASLLLRAAVPRLDQTGAAFSDFALLAILCCGCASPLMSAALRECYRESVLVFARWATGPCRGISTSQAHNKVMQPIVEVAEARGDSCSLHSTIGAIESSATPRMDFARAAIRWDAYPSVEVRVGGDDHSQPRTPAFGHRTLTV